jgi:acetoin:2,6-dichlorophenolindophenol oxidoreductase subunit beta
MPSNRIIAFGEAVREALDIALERDAAVYVMGEGVGDPKGVFGTTKGLIDKYGPDRVIEMPVAENGMTGIAIGSALRGQRPIMVHQRIDFTLLAMDQLVNNAAKLPYIFGPTHKVPLVVRAIIGRGWGQSAQHAQALDAMYGQVPGLRVLMPATAHDAKGMLLAAASGDDPVMFIEHRWLHGVLGEVPEGHYTVSLEGARSARPGDDVTIVATSYMVIEALRAAEVLAGAGIHAEVVDLRVVRPLGTDLIRDSVSRSGRLVVVDTGYRTLGIGAEIVARIAHDCHGTLKAAPERVGLPDRPTPASRALVVGFYPLAADIVRAAARTLGLHSDQAATLAEKSRPPAGVTVDQPNPSFTGPF